MLNFETDTFQLQPLRTQHSSLEDSQVQVSLDGARSLQWLKQHADALEALLQKQGVVLLRGLNMMTSRQFGSALEAIFSEPLQQYQYRSTPRTALKASVYTASEYHPDQTILQHNESSYSNRWAMRLGFYCQQPAEQGGSTPISDSQLVFEAIDKDVREEFLAKKITYCRNYGMIDLPWQEVFQTADKAEVEAFCKENNIDFHWSEEGLRTIQTNPAAAIHPSTQKPVWFNQAHLFHESALPADVREKLNSIYAPQALPRNCFFGDGSEIPDNMLNHIRDVYRDHTLAFQWQANDLMLLDNMRYTHGRTPYSGERKVLVGMTRSNDWHHCSYPDIEEVLQ